jgi:hypothetical protein
MSTAEQVEFLFHQRSSELSGRRRQPAECNMHLVIDEVAADQLN